MMAVQMAEMMDDEWADQLVVVMVDQMVEMTDGILAVWMVEM